jgi:glycosyltransferase involved in cell wall biosynthesis
MAGPVAFLLKGYPRLSETFIAQEIRSLERLGLAIEIVALRRPTESQRHPVHDEIAAPVRYLPEYLHEAPLRVLRAWRRARRLSGYRAARRAWLADLKRDWTRNRIRRFGQACVLAAELPPAVRHVHAHFLHTPASVARYAALMRGHAWSVSAHAKDIWTTPDWELGEKLAAAAWAVTCSRAGQTRLNQAARRDDAAELCYHGLDLARFPPPAGFRAARDGSAGGDPVVILSVGRVVPKKGFDTVLQALARLPAELDWRFEHIGGGTALAALKRSAERLGIASRIAWLGAQAQSAVLDAYRRADLFVLASRIGDDGDRDGLPNVLMEAQSQGLACVSTRVGAIAELIEHGASGLLVAPDDPAALAAALAELIRDPERRQALGAAGLARVRREFSHDAAVARLAAKFGLAAGT